jgi:hypothetical protein
MQEHIKVRWRIILLVTQFYTEENSFQCSSIILSAFSRGFPVAQLKFRILKEVTCSNNSTRATVSSQLVKVNKSDPSVRTKISHHYLLTFFIRSDFLLHFSYWGKKIVIPLCKTQQTNICISGKRRAQKYHIYRTPITTIISCVCQ